MAAFDHLKDPNVPMNPDGTIKNRRFERLALMLADGLDPSDAWAVVNREEFAGATDERKKGLQAYRRRVQASKVFKARVAVVREEREAYLKEGFWGEVALAAKRSYDVARAADDAKSMLEAAKLMLQVAEKRAASQDPPEESLPVDSEKSAKGPGRPVQESPQSIRTPSAVRGLLLEKGVKVPEPTAN